MEPNQLVKLAPYKLAFILNKHKRPFPSCSAFVEFASSADPNSGVFSRMPSSRETVTTYSRSSSEHLGARLNQTNEECTVLEHYC